MCGKVRNAPGRTIPECNCFLKSKLVNIIDLTDAERMNRQPKECENFKEFSDLYIKLWEQNRREAGKCEWRLVASLL